MDKQLEAHPPAAYEWLLDYWAYCETIIRCALHTLEQIDAGKELRRVYPIFMRQYFDAYWTWV